MMGAFAVIASAAILHLAPPHRLDDCIARTLASHPQVFVFPEEIEVLACGDETWGCVSAGGIVVNASAPEWLVPAIMEHEAAHFGCGWPSWHPGGRQVWVADPIG